MRGKPRVGDVLEVRLRDGRLAYLQMVSESSIGEVARVLPGRFESAPKDLGTLVARPHEYLMFAVLGMLVSDGHARQAGNWPVPEGSWSGLRLSPRFDKSGQRVEAWVVTDGRIARQRLEALPAALRKDLPVWEIGDSMHVIDMLAASHEGGMVGIEIDAWRRDHGLAVPGPIEPDGEASEQGVQHFALFPHGVALKKTVSDLERRGFGCSVFTRPEIDGQLLVIAAGHSLAGSVNDQWDVVEKVVAAAGGEYDGWEAPVPPSG